jgi:hypothetical protein
MAITFTTPIPTDKWLFSEENRIVEFNTDSGVQPVYCDINIGVDAQVRIYPLPNGSFWVNLKDFISPLLRNYADDVDPTTIDPLDIDTFVFNWDRIFLHSSIDFTLRLIDNTQETSSFVPFILLGAEQLYNYKKGFTIENLDAAILSPIKRDTANRFYLKYWEGYPFDFCITRNISGIDSSQTITNNTNGITSPAIATPYDVNRLFISDGDSNVTLEDYLPLVQGYNELVTDSGNYIEVTKIDSQCGIYLKWLNQYGEYNYWLFNNQNKVDKRIRNLGEINNDFFNKENTISQSQQLGKQSFDSFTVKADYLKSDDMDLLKGILTSSKVYLFTGTQFTRNSFNDWLEINIVNTNATTKNAREPNNELTVTFEMPNEYNITL